MRYKKENQITNYHIFCSDCNIEMVPRTTEKSYLSRGGSAKFYRKICYLCKQVNHPAGHRKYIDASSVNSTIEKHIVTFVDSLKANKGIYITKLKSHRAKLFQKRKRIREQIEKVKQKIHISVVDIVMNEPADKKKELTSIAALKVLAEEHEAQESSYNQLIEKIKGIIKKLANDERGMQYWRNVLCDSIVISEYKLIIHCSRIGKLLLHKEIISDSPK